MGWLAFAADGLRYAAIGLSAVTLVVLLLALRRSRATVFVDLALRATVLILALFYLTLVHDLAAGLPGDPAWYAAGVSAGYLLVAAFFLSVAAAIWDVTRRTDGAILVSRDFLVGLRTRTASMYGDSPSRFIVYAVGKESAQKAMRRFFGAGPIDAEKLWRRLPSWSRAIGYGRMRVLAKDVGHEVTVSVADTIESHEANAAGGCDMTRGYLAGMGSALHAGFDCECVEVRCAKLHGGDECEFTLHWFPIVSAAPQTEPPGTLRGVS